MRRSSIRPVDEIDPKALTQLFKDAVGAEGADVIFDPVGGDYAEAALRSIAWEGRYPGGRLSGRESRSCRST